MIRSRVAIFFLCAALSGVGACKDTSGGATTAPAATPGDTATPDKPTEPEGKPAEPEGKPAEPEGKPAQGGDVPAAPTTAYVECTPDTRKGGMCTREYRPVCGKKADDTRKTYPNPCNACSDLAIVGYFAGSCEAGPDPAK